MWECIRDSLVEIIGLGAVTALIEWLRRKGAAAFAGKALGKFLKGLLAKFIPGLGLFLLILDIILVITNCR
jgi:hypothetical protein